MSPDFKTFLLLLSLHLSHAVFLITDASRVGIRAPERRNLPEGTQTQHGAEGLITLEMGN